MYNLGMHMDGGVRIDVPWKWIQKWSNQLEADLQQRRLDGMVRGSRQAPQTGRRR